MSGAIGPGDFVECIGDWPGIGLRRGSVWLCEDVVRAPATCDMCDDIDAGVLMLKGYRPPAGYDGCCPCGFRPIYRPKSDLIDTLKQPAPERELQPA